MLTSDSPQTVAELRARIAAGKAAALARLAEHAADPSQPEVSRDVCANLAERMRRLLTALAAAAVLLTAVPAFAKMECQGTSCVDKALIREGAIQLYCSAHPGDPDCQALGWHYNSTDPIDQAIDRRMVEYYCRARPYIWACVSPFKPAPPILLEPER